jgi:hypothetical protein
MAGKRFQSGPQSTTKELAMENKSIKNKTLAVLFWVLQSWAQEPSSWNYRNGLTAYDADVDTRVVVARRFRVSLCLFKKLLRQRRQNRDEFQSIFRLGPTLPAKIQIPQTIKKPRALANTRLKCGTNVQPITPMVATSLHWPTCSSLRR